LNGEKDSAEVSAIPNQNLFLDAFQILRLETESVTGNCMETYCGSQSSSKCQKQNEFKAFYKPEELQEDYEKRLDSLVLDLVKTTFSDSKYDPSLPLWKKANLEPISCQRVAKDFFALEDFRERFVEPVPRRSILPGSLLRWVYVNSRGYFYHI